MQYDSKSNQLSDRQFYFGCFGPKCIALNLMQNGISNHTK
jgi:hypothetical protein